MNNFPKQFIKDINNMRDTIRVFKYLGVFDECSNTYYLDDFSMIFEKKELNYEQVKKEYIFTIYLKEKEAIEYTRTEDLDNKDVAFTIRQKDKEAIIEYLAFLNSKILDIELNKNNKTKTEKRLKL